MAQQLHAIHAFPGSIEELFDLHAELVGRAIAYAESEPGSESIPGWVVEALRRHRDEGWPIPAPRIRQSGMTSRDRPIDVEHYTSGAYGDLFRLGSDTSGLEDGDNDQAGRASGQVCADAPSLSPQGFHGQSEAFTDIDPANTKVEPGNVGTLHESEDDALTRELHAELKLRCGRQRGRVIEGLRVHVAGSTSLIICATSEDMRLVQRELIGALQCILEQLGVPSQLVFATRAGWEARLHDAGNARSRPDMLQGRPALT